jgi:fimbrial isopeptide formation D2 family protein/LPXTG-motif cell wall-anchored protein
MKRVKSIFAALLALTLALALSIPAFAAESHSITVESKTEGHTFNAYQIFSGNYTKKGTTGVLSNIGWGTGVNGEDVLTALKSDSALSGIFAECKNATDVAEALAKTTDAATTDAFAAVVAKNLTADVAATCNTPTGTYNYVLSGLKDGYYFVNEGKLAGGADAAYTKYIIEVVGEDVSVKAKTDSPSVTKKVLENNAAGHKDTWNDAADYGFGEKVPFRLVGSVPDMSNYQTYSYCFDDTLSSGLSFNKSSVKVYCASGDTMLAVNSSTATGAAGTEISSSNYDITEGSNGFILKFTDLKKVSGIDNGKYIVVEYNATLNNTAAVGNPGNPNEVTLTYSNNPNQGGEGDTSTTPKDEVVVFTFELPINKIDGSDKSALTGAEFALYKTEEDAKAGNNAISFTGENGSYKLGGTDTTLKADNKGHYAVQGLDQGTYYLMETKAPEGYNRLTDAQKVTVAPAYDGTAYENHIPDATNDQLKSVDLTLNGTDAGTAITIANNSGSTLPSTGGIGTKIFTFGGIALMAGAIIVFATKRKASRTED